MSDVAALPCADKMVFDSQQAANAAATTLRHQRGGKLRSYQCRHCKLWHLTGQPA